MTTSVPDSPVKSTPTSCSSEPSMFLQQSTSAHSQDVSHLLTKIFRQLYTHDSVPSDTVEYLNTSRGSSDTYHEEYVKALQKVQIERSRRMSEAAMLERHIMQAQARATSADERELTRISAFKEGFPDLGLPPSRSYFRSCIDSNLLRRYKLITPEDFVKEECLPVPAPSGSPMPMYTKSTRSSFIKTRASQEEEVMPQVEQEESFQHIASDFDTDATLEMLPPKGEEVKMSRGNKAKKLWMAEMPAEEREQNRAQLAILEDRVNFLRNKRFLEPSDPKAAGSLIRPKQQKPKEFGIKPMPEPVIYEEPDGVFLARPQVIQFTQYAVGIVYEITLELKNISSVLRPVRVIPPKTEYFSVSLGAFPGEHGLVAPGMSCYYTIRFSPDSLGDFDDILKIETQAREPLYVRLEGRRPPPILSLSETFHMEECLIGGYKVGQFTVKNTGGSGRFCVLPTSSWPAANFKTVISASCVVVPPFEVRPSMFELRRDSTMLLEVLFAPTALDDYSQSIAIVCDNCQVKYFNITGRGQTAEVKLLTVEGGQTEIQMGEMCDVTADHHVRFTTLNAYTYMQKVLIVKNCVDVELPYSWVVIKPHILTPDPTGTEVAPIPMERVQEEEAAFSVHPESGVLRPSTDEEFVITFAPPKVGSYHNVLHLVLRNIPRVPGKADEEDCSSCSNLLSPRITMPSKSKLPSESLVEDVTSLEIEVKGECEPLSVILQPYAVHVPGSILVETSIKKPFRMINQSVCSIIFQWENVSDNYILEVEPPVAELAGRSEMDFELTISCAEPCRIDHTLLCYVQHLETPLTLHVTAEVKGPEVVIECGSIDLGLVRLGETASFELTLHNMSRVQACWSLDELVNLGTPTLEHFPRLSSLSPSGKILLSKKEEDSQGYELVFTPKQSVLRPVEHQTVTVLFIPSKCQSIRTLIELRVQDGAASTVALQAEVQQPDVCLLSCEILLSEVFIGVPTFHQVTLINKTLLATEFEWGELQFCPSNESMEMSGSGDGSHNARLKVPIAKLFNEKDYDYYSISFNPHSGVIGPREQVVVQMRFLARRMFAIPNFRVMCQIKDMDLSLFLAIYGYVSGPKVAFNVIPVSDSTDDSIMDFGADVPLGSNPSRQISVKNHTAIPTQYKLAVRSFPGPRPPTPPGSRPHDDSKRGSRILARTPNLADPLSQTPEKAHNDLCKIVLRENRGIAFIVEPSEGKLAPYEEIIVTVTAFSDMWGTYSDAINCQTIANNGLSNRCHQLPIKMAVVGCPIYFQMTSPQSRGKAPKLRFGTHVCGAPPIRRHMKIINSGPVDIRLDWNMYKEDKASQKLLDVKFLFGTILPILDADGNEILPPTEDPGKILHRQTDHFFIPNSPDSTPPSTQETMDMELDTVPRDDIPRSKVVRLLLQPHDGIEETRDSGPYSIEPTQLVIPARRYGTITITFTPLKCDVLESGVDCNGYAHGHMSLDAPNAQKVPLVARLEKYHVQPLRLDMTAHCKPALLSVECIDDDEMSYRSAASDLLDIDGQVLTETLKLSSCTVSNNTLTPLTFGLSTTKPFYIMAEAASRGRHRDNRMLQMQQLTLYPRQNLMVHVAFRLSSDLLNYVDGATDENAESFELDQSGCETKLHFRRLLVVSFSNGTEQRTPLSATVYVPSLTLSKDSLDFGTCLVGQQRFQQLILSNPSCSDSRWIAELESMSENCTETTFEVQPSCGHLDAYSTCVADNKVLLTFSFQAKHAEEYTAVFVLHGILGEEPRRLKVRGEGSYDGLFEAQVNI